jgi:putative endonuclease
MPKLPTIVPDTRCEPVPIVAKPWFVYLVRAANGALYCGISDDPQRRFAQHRSGKGARFFYSSPAQALVYIEACTDKGAALREERGIKQLKKSAKEALVSAYALIEAADGVPSA